MVLGKTKIDGSEAAKIRCSDTLENRVYINIGECEYNSVDHGQYDRRLERQTA